MIRPIRGMKSEVSMRVITIQYDGYNRQFTLAKNQDAKALEDGGEYLLMDFSSCDLEPAEMEKMEHPVSCGAIHSRH